jgi:hypothetical protein
MNIQNLCHKMLTLTLLLGVLLGATGLTVRAEALTLPDPIVLTGPVIVVNDGPGGQTDPHISGPWVSYTDNSIYSIRVQNVDVEGSDRVIARPDAKLDSLSDISGMQVVFARVSDGAYEGIYSAQIDAAGNPGQPQEVLPLGVPAPRRRTAVGGGVIAFEDWTYTSIPNYSQPEITLFDPATPNDGVRLTNDEVADQWPAVSPDGSTVVWGKCASATACDVWQATRSAGWAPLQLTTSTARESLPDTDGTYVVYGSNEGGDDNIVYQPVGGGPATTLVLPGVQRNPNISNGVILFESSAALGAPFGLFAYDLATELLYQVNNTAVNAMLSDISVSADGQIYVVWAQPKTVYPYDLDVYAFRFERQYPQPEPEPDPQPALTAQALFDQDKAHRAGSVVPIRLRLLDASGANVSSPARLVTATGLVQQDDTPVLALVESAGNSSPDSAFRYDAALGGYIYNLSTKGMAAGTWALQFAVGGDTHAYAVEFDLR